MDRVTAPLPDVDDADITLPLNLVRAQLTPGTDVRVELPVGARCSECSSASVSAVACPTCGGTGVARVAQNITVRIPPGVLTGTILRLGGAGRRRPHSAGFGSVCLSVVVADEVPRPALHLDAEFGTALQFALHVVAALGLFTVPLVASDLWTGPSSAELWAFDLACVLVPLASLGLAFWRDRGSSFRFWALGLSVVTPLGWGGLAVSDDRSWVGIIVCAVGTILAGACMWAARQSSVEPLDWLSRQGPGPFREIVGVQLASRFSVLDDQLVIEILAQNAWTGARQLEVSLQSPDGSLASRVDGFAAIRQTLLPLEHGVLRWTVPFRPGPSARGKLYLAFEAKGIGGRRVVHRRQPRVENRVERATQVAYLFAATLVWGGGQYVELDLPQQSLPAPPSTQQWLPAP